MNISYFRSSQVRLVAKISILSTIILFIQICWADNFSKVKKNLVAKYPSVVMIDVNQLYQELNSKGEYYLLLDVRSPKEYAVSHIYQAHNAPNIEKALEILQAKSRQTPILVYCSLGYRSAELALELQNQGFSQVTNLAGSLFEWVDKDYPIYQGDNQVQKVHPYNLWWGRYLRSDYRSYRP